MAVPILLATNARDESFGGVTYHIQGELVPVLHIELGGVPVFLNTTSFCGRTFPSRSG